MTKALESENNDEVENPEMNYKLLNESKVVNNNFMN